MRHFRTASFGSMLSLWLSLSPGCGDDDGPAAGSDATRVDSGVVVRDGGRTDGAMVVDAGAMDAGRAADGGGAVDGSSSIDSGRLFDAGRESCDAAPTFDCATPLGGGRCDDTVVSPSCVGGGWACPAGTIDARACVCIGRPPGSACVCTATGWACGVDGGAATCASGPGACFSCGPSAQCVKGVEYCQEISGGPAGSEPSYSCPALPDACGTMPTCACIATGGGTFCSTDADGNITVRIAAP